MSEWREVKLGEVVTFQRGHDLPKSKMIKGKYPVAGSNGIIGFHNEFTTTGPGITIGRSGNIGTPHFYKNNYWAHNTVLFVKDFKSNNELYMFYFLKTLDFYQFNTGSAVPSLNRNHIHQLEIKIPSLPKQKAIASVLSSLDDKIDLLHRQNETLEKMAETLFRQWFVEEAKEDWEEGTLGNIIKIQNGYAFKSKDFKEFGNNGIIKIKNISSEIVDINNVDFVQESIVQNISDKFRVMPSDILIAMTGAEIGKLGLMPETNRTLWLNQRVGMLVEKFKGSKYIAYLHLKSDFGQDYIDNTATGSAQPNISGVGIENCAFPKLEESTIREYSLQLEELYKRIVFNLGQIQTLTNLRDTLLPKLMSGEVRVEN